MFYPHNRGAMHVAVIVLYALTAGIAGYVSASMHKKFGGTNWVRNVLLAAGLLTGNESERRFTTAQNVI
eukprot:SAG31_NODE_4066_length_3623_cov_2.164302_2_plen_69_part_00